MSARRSGDEPCDGCGDETPAALGRTVTLTVDRSEVDAQFLCPDCFAAWIARYDDEMRTAVAGPEERSDIIVD